MADASSPDDIIPRTYDGPKQRVYLTQKLHRRHTLYWHFSNDFSRTVRSFLA